MALSYSMQEPNVVDDYATRLADSYGFGGISEDYPQFSEAIFYLRNVLDFGSPLLEDFNHNSVSLPFREAEDYCLSCPYEGEQPAFNTWRYWSSEDEPYFGFSDCWGTCVDVGHGSHLETIDDAFPGEEQVDSLVSLNEHADNQVSWEEGPFPGYESCLGYAREEGPDCCSWQEPSYGYTYSIDDLGLCGSILHYWPCLMQKHPITNIE